MEFSHHAAKVAYHRHTQHGGSKNKKSPLLQTYEHWYRIVQHRFRNKEIHDNEPINRNDRDEETIQRRRQASLQSSAAAHSTNWRANCRREGKRWIPNVRAADNNDTEIEMEI